MLLRRVIGDVLRARRQDQHRTLREVSHAANVSLGYLSEIERGQKEPSSELLAAICDALGSELSDVLRAASDSLAQLERDGAAVPVPALSEPELVDPQVPEPEFAEATRALAAAGGDGELVSDGAVAVSVRRNGPLRTTLCTVPARRTAELAAAGSG